MRETLQWEENLYIRQLSISRLISLCIDAMSVIVIRKNYYSAFWQAPQFIEWPTAGHNILWPEAEAVAAAAASAISLAADNFERNRDTDDWISIIPESLVSVCCASMHFYERMNSAVHLSDICKQTQAHYMYTYMYAYTIIHCICLAV